jgi:hypothetical protein
MSLLSTAALVLALAIFLRSPPLPDAQRLPAEHPEMRIALLRPVVAFATIADPAARSVALFQEAGRVMQHPRCMNCHPRDDRPTQQAAMRPHVPRVIGSSDGRGEPTLRCSTCHNDANFAASGVPGNPNWRLAPREMAWQGKTLGEICRQLLDPQRAHMDGAELLRHMAADELVGWAWHPGARREPAPGTQAEFGALIKAWIETGAQCPT